MVYLLKCVGQVHLRRVDPLTPADPHVLPHSKSPSARSAFDKHIMPREAINRKRTARMMRHPVRIVHSRRPELPLDSDFVQITFVRDALAAEAVPGIN